MTNLIFRGALQCLSKKRYQNVKIEIREANRKESDATGFI